jgi:alpha-ketoglutarate-dependent taurine dioxygenase
VFEGESLSATDLHDLTSHFGEPHVHHDDEGVVRADGVPDVLEMRKEPSGTRLFGGECWHADVTFAKPAGYVSILHALTIPPVGGDTAFSSTVAAFAALSSTMKPFGAVLGHGEISYAALMPCTATTVRSSRTEMA